MTYILDANVFIEAKNRHYGFDVVPGFWEWLDDANDRGVVCSVAKVRDELLDGGDELTEWARDRPEFFPSPDDAVVSSLRDLVMWANDSEYEDGAVNTFLQAGDAYLVAHAHAHGLTVVTHEIASPSVKKIKIPNACDGRGVPHCAPFAMLRNEGARFVLGEP